VNGLGEVAGTAPHGPMTRGEVDDVEVLEVGDFGKHGIACPGQLQHLRTRDRAAHQGGPDLAAGIVSEVDGLTKHGSGLRDGPGPKTLEGLCAQAFEACLPCEDVEGRQWKLLHLIREVWGEDASRRHGAGVDPHHPVDKLRMSVEDKAYRGVSPTMSHDSRGLILGNPESRNHVYDGRGLIVEGLGRTFRVIPVETWQSHRDCTKVVGHQMFKDFIPSPGAQPVAGDEDDDRTVRSECHGLTLGGIPVRSMSLFMS
jgi:hypothetical protein